MTRRSAIKAAFGGLFAGITGLFCKKPKPEKSVVIHQYTWTPEPRTPEEAANGRWTVEILDPADRKT